MPIKEPDEGRWFALRVRVIQQVDHGETDPVTSLGHSVSRVKAFDMRIRLDGVS